MGIRPRKIEEFQNKFYSSHLHSNLLHLKIITVQININKHTHHRELVLRQQLDLTCRTPCPTQLSPLWPFIAPSHVEVVKKSSKDQARAPQPLGTNAFCSQCWLIAPNSTKEKPGSRCQLIAWVVLRMPLLLMYSQQIQLSQTKSDLTMRLNILRVSSFLGCSSRYQQNGAPLLRCVHSIWDNRWPQRHVGDKMAIFIQGPTTTTTDCLTLDLRLSPITGKIQLRALSRLGWCTSNTENQARQIRLRKNLKKGSQNNQKSDKHKLWEET